MVFKIREQVRKYVQENNLKSLVIGISGGLDSAVVAALCQEEYIGVPLLGVNISLENSLESIEKAEHIGRSYCSGYLEFSDWEEKHFSRESIESQSFKTVPFYERVFDVLNQTNSFAEAMGFALPNENIRKGNMKARLRMMTLYDLAKKTGGAVLSTDNLSEYYAGFWTLHGDVGDIAPIQYLWKGSEVVNLAYELGIREDIITQAPSDGLGVTDENTDEAQIGMSYPIFDEMIKIYLRGGNVNSEKFKKAVRLYEGTAYKRKGTFVIPKENLC